MIGIKLNGVLLKLKVGKNDAGQIERYSPFFSIDQINAEYSTPITIPYTPENAVALGFTFQYYTRREKKIYAVEHYDGLTIRGKCTLVVETANLDWNNIEGSDLSGYLLYGISSFFQDVKGKYLTDLVLGGPRTFNWTTSNPDDGSGGFWQHLHDAWTDDTIPYKFVPVRNETWYLDVEYLNGLGDDAKLKYDPVNNPIVPFINIKYLLEQIFAENGWQVDFSGINDSDWEKLILYSNRNIEFYTKGYTVDSTTHIATPVYNPKSSISFSLGDYLPPKKLISDFIVQLFGRYGFAPVFNLGDKLCRFVAVKESRNGKKVDWTKYCNPKMPSTFSDDPKIFSFTNDIDSNDEFPSSPDFTGKTIGPPLITKQHLAAPTPAMEGLVRYCWRENQWITPTVDSTTNLYEWTVFADNIYNQEPSGNTDTFATTISTLPVYLTEYRTFQTNKFYAYFPYLKESKDKEFGYRTLLYQGMVWEQNSDGGLGETKYPYASSVCNRPVDNNDNLTWSNVYRHIRDKGTSSQKDYGLIEYWFADFCKLLNSGEEVEATLYLPIHELFSYTWEQVILVQQIPYLVKKIVEPLPYTGFVQATMKRLIAAVPDVIGIVTDPRLPDGLYARLTPINVRSGDWTLGLYSGWTDNQLCDVKVEFFSDAAATKPYITTGGILVYVSCSNYYNADHAPVPFTVQWNLSSQSQVIYTGVMYAGTNSLTGTVEYADWHLEPDPNGIYTVIQ